MISTADLYDAHGESVQVAEPVFRHFGGITSFYGEIETIKTFEDNSLVRAALESAGRGRVLVVDGGGSLRCALLGDQLAALAVKNGWSGVVVNGCVRDSQALAGMSLGVLALAPNPRKSLKRGLGERGVAVEFAGLQLRPGQHLYADTDGVVVSESPLPINELK